MEITNRIIFLNILFIANFDIFQTASINNNIDQHIKNHLITRRSINNDDNPSDMSNLPPLLFPEDPRTYKIVSPTNATALKILQHNEDIQEKSPEKNSIDDLGIPTGLPIESMLITDEPKISQNDLKNQVEEIQSPDLSESAVELEEQFRNPSANLRMNDVFAQDIETDEPKLHNGYITIIFAGVLAVICIAIYVGLISWRSYLEKRYGMREQLVTQDDYYNTNDVRHFEL